MARAKRGHDSGHITRKPLGYAVWLRIEHPLPGAAGDAARLTLARLGVALCCGRKQRPESLDAPSPTWSPPWWAGFWLPPLVTHSDAASHSATGRGGALHGKRYSDGGFRA
jgi:hypothetical protein